MGSGTTVRTPLERKLLEFQVKPPERVGNVPRVAPEKFVGVKSKESPLFPV